MAPVAASASAARELLPPLVSSLGSANARVRMRAAVDLADLGPHAAQALPALRVSAVDDAEESVRISSLFAVSVVGGSDGADFLARVVLEGKTPRDRSMAIAGLSRMGDGSHLRVLREAVEHPDALVHVRALEAIRSIGGERAREIASEIFHRPGRREDTRDPRLRLTAAVSLLGIEEAAEAELIRAIGATDLEGRSAALGVAASLVGLGAPVSGGLAAQIAAAAREVSRLSTPAREDNGAVQERVTALYLLAAHGDEDAVTDLEAMAAGPRISALPAAAALGRLSRVNDQIRERREAAFARIGARGDPLAVSKLTEALTGHNDDDLMTRTSTTAQTLNRPIGRGPDLTPLLRSLAATLWIVRDPQTRHNAARLLGFSDAPEAMEILRDAVEAERDEAVRLTLRTALARQGFRRGGADLAEHSGSCETPHRMRASARHVLTV